MIEVRFDIGDYFRYNLIFGRQSEILIKSLTTRVDAIKGFDSFGESLSILYVDSYMERFLQYPLFNFQIRGSETWFQLLLILVILSSDD